MGLPWKKRLAKEWLTLVPQRDLLIDHPEYKT